MRLCAVDPGGPQVIIIEEEWGDWLVTQKQMDAAINHFIESGATIKAIKAAIECRQFSKAAGIIEVLVSASPAPRLSVCPAAVNASTLLLYMLRATLSDSAVRLHDPTRIAPYPILTGQGPCEPREAVPCSAACTARLLQLYGNRSFAQPLPQCAQPPSLKLLSSQDPREAMPYFRRIAQHYETTGALDEAERYYIRADMARDAVEMYSRAGKWEAAQRVARGYLTENEMRQFYRAKAAEFEQAGKFREAEKAYVAAGGDEVDKAIAMYKRAKMYDQMIRLVTNYRKEKVAEVGAGCACAFWGGFCWTVKRIRCRNEARTSCGELGRVRTLVLYCQARYPCRSTTVMLTLALLGPLCPPGAHPHCAAAGGGGQPARRREALRGGQGRQCTVPWPLQLNAPV